MKLLTVILCCGALLLGSIVWEVQAKCKAGCRVALESYYVWGGLNLTYISSLFNQPITAILQYKPLGMDQNSCRLEVSPGDCLNVSLSCDCINRYFLGHTFAYLTRTCNFSITSCCTPLLSSLFHFFTNWLLRVNVYDPTRMPDYMIINITLNCLCGDRHISRDFGLFATYSLRVGENLMGIAEESGLPSSLLQMYNPGVNFSVGTWLVFLPAKAKVPDLSRFPYAQYWYEVQLIHNQQHKCQFLTRTSPGSLLV
ncbi:hypothetical protein MLD38_021063 [Melastoma candidum]|uniref:Uncharacterized protein n=1 Tax=Melastoma candidum TaxID=119954 RepID=A0ACB9QFV5_9MYRT|nr:hypothetical protein MLD38_021063 [Melastoma candidum]